MSVWTYLRLATERRVAAYCLVANASPPQVMPVGTVAAPTLKQENIIRDRFRPHDGQLLKTNLHGVDAVTLWRGDRIEAICFRCETEAKSYPGIRNLTHQDRDVGFDHFSAEPMPGPLMARPLSLDNPGHSQVLANRC